MYPNRREPTGILAMTRLWFTLKFSGPKRSEVMETAMDVMAPVHAPMVAVLMNILWMGLAIGRKS